MVLPAVLRDPARDPEQASRRDGARRFHPYPRVPAMARYVDSALGALSSALSPVLLGVRDRVHRPRLARLEASGRQLRPVGAHLHCLLLRFFPRDPAGARQGRKNQVAAELDFRIGATRSSLILQQSLSNGNVRTEAPGAIWNLIGCCTGRSAAPCLPKCMV